MTSRAASDRFESMPASPFYVGLVLCGLATVLLGPILPILSARWALNDLHSGTLFIAQFAASTIGAVLSSYYRRRSIVLGYLSIALGLALLAIGGYTAALFALALIGAGVGGAVTASNLIFGTEYPEKRGALLTRVNFSWGVGAVASPQLVALAVRHSSLSHFLLLASLCTFGIFLFFLPLLKAGHAQHLSRHDTHPGLVHFPIFFLFSMILFLYVGGETAISGWIATYTHRFENLSPARSSLIVSVFWLAIVVCRGLLSFLLKIFSELVLLFLGLFLAMAGVAVFLFPHTPAITIAAVVAAGFGCAPVYPLAVSRLLARTGRSRHTGWIFAICGSGGAVVPWLTGLLSQHSGSLSLAFVVPLAALACIALCSALESVVPAPTGKMNSSEQ
jgi:MFS transporter, FHS family, glucose/mannose:H+ symporter